MSISFKKFIEFVEFDGDVSDEQINEIFGLFRNNQKIDKLRKEREKLKGMSAEKKAELDQALKDFAAGRKTAVTDRVKGALKDVDWDDVLGADDRKYLAKRDRMTTESKDDVSYALKMVKAAGFPYKGKTLDALRKEHAKELLSSDYHDQWHMRVSDALGMSRMNKDALEKIAEGLTEAAGKVKAFKIEIPKGLSDRAIHGFIEDQSVVTIEDFERKGNVVYLYPHFEHDYDPHMTGAMQSAFNRYLKDNGLN